TERHICVRNAEVSSIAILHPLDVSPVSLHFHFVMHTRVPLPICETIANSFTNRLVPPRPNPIPPPVVYPSFSASSMSGIPGPWSVNVRRTPRRLLSLSDSRITSPPPP